MSRSTGSGERSTSVTEGLSEVTQPVFERNGKYLYVLASTDAGPALDWFALSNAGLTRTRAIYAIALKKANVSISLRGATSIVGPTLTPRRPSTRQASAARRRSFTPSRSTTTTVSRSPNCW